MALSILTSPSAAQACIDFAPFEIEDIRQADAVFAGQLVAYERVSPGRPGSLGDYGLLTVRVDEVIKGQVPRRIELAWYNSMFGIPDERPTDVPLIIAAFQGEYDLPGPVWRVLQSPCAAAFLLDDTPESRADVRKALSGEPVPPRDYFALQHAEFSRNQAAAAQPPVKKETDLPAPGWVAAILAAIALAAWGMARRKG